MRIATRISLSLFLLIGCGGDGTRPEDMSARAHEKEAKEAEQAAELHKSASTGADPADRSASRHWALASSLAARAEAHRKAAAELRANEAAECAGLPEAEHGSCPMIAYRVKNVEQTPQGVRVTYAGPTPEKLLREAKCHASHQATERGKDLPGCPMYSADLKIDVEASEGGAVLVLTSENAETRKALNEVYVESP